MDQGFHFESFCSGTPSSYQFSALPFPRHNVEHEVTEKSQNCLIPSHWCRWCYLIVLHRKVSWGNTQGPPAGERCFLSEGLGFFPTWSSMSGIMQLPAHRGLLPKEGHRHRGSRSHSWGQEVRNSPQSSQGSGGGETQDTRGSTTDQHGDWWGLSSSY